MEQGFSFFLGSPAFAGTDQPVPGRAPFRAPRSPRWNAAPHLLSETPRAALWGRRGAVVRPREVGWRSGEPVFRRAYYNQNSIEDPKGHDDDDADYVSGLKTTNRTLQHQRTNNFASGTAMQPAHSTIHNPSTHRPNLPRCTAKQLYKVWARTMGLD